MPGRRVFDLIEIPDELLTEAEDAAPAWAMT